MEIQSLTIGFPHSTTPLHCPVTLSCYTILLHCPVTLSCYTVLLLYPVTLSCYTLLLLSCYTILLHYPVTLSCYCPVTLSCYTVLLHCPVNVKHQDRWWQVCLPQTNTKLWCLNPNNVLQNEDFEYIPCFIVVFSRRYLSDHKSILCHSVILEHFP